MLTNYFNGKTLNKSVNPDEAVACGAAVEAAILNNDQHPSVRDVLLMDVNPLSLGLDVLGGKTHVVVPRNTSIPVQRTEGFKMHRDDQTCANFTVVEGNKLSQIFSPAHFPKFNNIYEALQHFGQCLVPER